MAQPRVPVAAAGSRGASDPWGNAALGGDADGAAPRLPGEKKKNVKNTMVHSQSWDG